MGFAVIFVTGRGRVVPALCKLLHEFICSDLRTRHFFGIVHANVGLVRYTGRLYLQRRPYRLQISTHLPRLCIILVIRYYCYVMYITSTPIYYFYTQRAVVSSSAFSSRMRYWSVSNGRSKL